MDIAHMRQALACAREHSLHYAGGPFGAVIVKDGQIVAKGWNTVTSDNDPTAHAEVNAIRRACTALGVYDLSNCEIYATTEPCPMCLGAIYWARLSALYFGNTRHEAARLGFDDALIYTEFLKPITSRQLSTVGGLLSGEIDKLFAEWQALAGKKLY